MVPLNKKLFRDLWRMKGQGFAIALVIACGVATMVTFFGMLLSLQDTRDAYYERYRFAHVFANLKRGPENLTKKIAALDGVGAVQRSYRH